MAGLVGYSSSDDDQDSEEETQRQTLRHMNDRVDSGVTKKEESPERTTVAAAAATRIAAGSNGGTYSRHVEEPSLPATRVPADDVAVGPQVGPQQPVPPVEGALELPPVGGQDDALLIGPSRPPATTHVSSSSGDGGSSGTATAPVAVVAAYAGGVEEDANNEADAVPSEGGGDGDDPPLSPFSAERAAVRQATLPRVADLDIPGSPRGTPPPTLDALGEKIDTFLALKRDKGVHFNARLAQSDAMKNPALMDKLLAFVGLGEGEDEDEDDAGGISAQYATTLPPSLWDPAALPAWAHRKPLRALQDDMTKRRARAPGEKVAFVPAGAAGSGTGTGTGTAPASILGKRRPRPA